jgi:hypothetical protein
LAPNCQRDVYRCPARCRQMRRLLPQRSIKPRLHRLHCVLDVRG